MNARDKGGKGETAGAIQSVPCAAAAQPQLPIDVEGLGMKSVWAGPCCLTGFVL
jgi:hypothetical protein